MLNQISKQFGYASAGLLTGLASLKYFPQALSPDILLRSDPLFEVWNPRAAFLSLGIPFPQGAQHASVSRFLSSSACPPYLTDLHLISTMSELVFSAPECDKLHTESSCQHEGRQSTAPPHSTGPAENCTRSMQKSNHLGVGVRGGQVRKHQ